MSTILQVRSDATVAEFIFDLDPEAPAKPFRFDPTEELPLPSFEDRTTDTVAWITDKGGVEVPKSRWLNGDIHRAVLTAEGSGIRHAPLPSWVAVEVFFTERPHLAPAWEVLSDLSVEA